MIKYHDNTIEPQYGADHKLLNNWNPNISYQDNEYIRVYFRIETIGFSGMNGNFDTEDAGRKFTEEKLKVFQSIGWECEKPEYSGYCMTVIKGKQELYLHPQDFSGKVLKSDVKRIAEALENNETFSLRWVDVYDTIYEISDAEYDKYLETKREDVRKMLFESCKTKRTNQYKYTRDICNTIGSRIMLHRIEDKEFYMSNRQASGFVVAVMEDMANEGYLLLGEHNGYRLVRTLNKGELKKAKLKEIA